MLLLAHTDTLHGTRSGLATKKLMERAYGIFGDNRYRRLATISVAHLYNLRQHPGYRHQRQVWTKTRPATVPIGERRAPTPNNRPGYLRV
ncbi:integrase, catalytic region, partial [mine drainage metagenome]